MPCIHRSYAANIILWQNIKFIHSYATNRIRGAINAKYNSNDKTTILTTILHDISLEMQCDDVQRVSRANLSHYTSSKVHKQLSNNT